MADDRNKDDIFIKDKRKSNKFFVTSSDAVTDGVNKTTVSSSIFTEMSKSFSEGEHLIDPSIRENFGGVLYMLQQMEEDIDGIYNEVSASVFQASYLPFATIDSCSFGVISSSLFPDNDDKYDLGSSTKQWKDLYVDGTAYIDAIDLNGTNIATTLTAKATTAAVAGDLLPSQDGKWDLGSGTYEWQDLHIDGTANIDRLDIDRIGTDLIPVTPAQKGSGQNLGSGKARWSRLWLASNIDVSGSELIISSPSASVAGDDFNVVVSGSIVAGDTDSGSIGTIDAPFKDLYVQSSSIYLADMSTHNFGAGNKNWNQMSKAEKLQRSTVFQKDDVDKLKRGESLHDSGIISASGDLFVSGSTKLIGQTEIHGVTNIHGLTDIRGGFRVNGNAISDDELRTLEGLNATTAELNMLDGIGTTAVHTQLAAKQNTLTFGKSSGNALKSEEALTTNDVLLMGSSNVKGRTYSELKGDLSLVKGDVGLGNVDNTTDANKPVSTATQTALNAKATTAGVTADLLPHKDGTHDLGSSTYEWKDLYVDGVAHVDELNLGVISTDLLPKTPAQKLSGQNLGSAKRRWSRIWLASNIDVSGSELIISSPSASVAGDDFNVVVSGSIVAGDTDSGSIGTIDAPFKDLYVQSSSIYLADMSSHNFGQGSKSWKQMSKSEKLQRSTVFQKDDVDKLKRGESLNDSGIISASGDLFVSGSTKLIGNTEIHGVTNIHGITDIRGGLRINEQAITDNELRALRGLSTDDSLQEQLNAKEPTIGSSNRVNASHVGTGVVSNTEFNYINGVTSAIQTQLNTKALKTHISGAFTSLSASIATDINNAGGDDLSSVAKNIVPSTDNARDLGSSTKEWRNLYVDGVAYIDNGQIGAGSFTGEILASQLGINGLFHLEKSPNTVTQNGVLDARTKNLFILNNKVEITGIRGGGITGQIVTLISLGANVAHHQEKTVTSTEQFRFPLNRDLTFRGPVAHQFIYGGSYWIRLW